MNDQVLERMAGNHFYSTPSWLRLCDLEYGSPGSFVTVEATDGTRFGVPTARLADLPPWSRYSWNSTLHAAGAETLPSEGTLIGPREGFQTHLLTDGREPTSRDTSALISAVREHHDANGGGACVAMFLTTADVRRLREAGIDSPPVLLDVEPWIHVPDGGWNPWFESLASQKRRRSVTRDVERFHEAGYRIERVPLSTCFQDLGEAAAQTLRKHGYTADAQVEATSLGRHAAAMSTQAVVALCRRSEDAPVGFCLYYVHGDVVYVRWVGFEYDRLLPKGSEYFNVSFYSQVRLCESVGAHWIAPGVGLPKTKALRGAELRPLWMVDLGRTLRSSSNAKRISEHNRALIAELDEDSVTRSALADPDSWEDLL